MQCYNREFITRLGNCIGRTIKIGMLTPSEMSTGSAKIERGKYARVCVELDLQKKLVPRVIAAHSVYQVEYEGLGLFCFSCGRYGHRKEHCQWVYSDGNRGSEARVSENRPIITAPAIGTASSMGKSMLNAEDQFGSWMIVGKARKERYSGRRTHSSAAPPQGSRSMNARPVAEGRPTSRFEALAGLDDDTGMGRLREQGKKVSGSRQADGERQEKGADHEDVTGKSDRTVTLTKVTVPQLQWKEKLPKDNKIMGKGKGGASGPKEREKAQGTKESRGKAKLGQEENKIAVGPSKNHMGRREHVVVEGNLIQGASSAIIS